MNSDYSNIFISYAKEDFSYAEKFYFFLKKKNLNPWMDKKELLPGQNWQNEIQKELQKANFIILILSNNSVNKRGYIQKEFKKAIDFSEEKLVSDVYIIPIKIDECKVPDNLTKYQWEQYNEDSFEKVFSSIEKQRNIYFNGNLTYLLNNEIQIINKITKDELGEKKPKHIYEFHYPQIISNKKYGEVNTIIEYELLQRKFDVRKNFIDYLKDDGHTIALDSSDPENSTTYCKFEIRFVNSKFISFSMYLTEYYTGTAHDNFYFLGFNFFVNPFYKFSLIDLFEDKETFLIKIRDVIHEKLMDIAKKEELERKDEDLDIRLEYSEDEDVSNSFYVFDEGLEAKEENFENYFFKEGSIAFIFNPYQITGGFNNFYFPEVSFDELKKIFPTEIKFFSFIESLE